MSTANPLIRFPGALGTELAARLDLPAQPPLGIACQATEHRRYSQHPRAPHQQARSEGLG